MVVTEDAHFFHQYVLDDRSSPVNEAAGRAAATGAGENGPFSLELVCILGGMGELACSEFILEDCKDASLSVPRRRQSPYGAATPSTLLSGSDPTESVVRARCVGSSMKHG